MADLPPLTAITVPAAQPPATAAVIFLHGLGDTGDGWAPVAPVLATHLPHVKFVFPNAPRQRVTLNFGMKMPSWYDITSLTNYDNQDEAGIMESSFRINALIRSEV